MIRLLEQNLLHAVERISIERGHDPRRCLLVAAGGAGPMFGAEVARELGCRRVYVPRQAGAFCAQGMLNSDVRRDFMSVVIGDLDAIAGDDVERRFAELESEARAALDAEGFEPAIQRIERGQQWSIRVDAPAFDRALIRRAFEADHQRMFGHIQPDGAIRITALRITGRGLIEIPEDKPLPRSTDTPQPRERRRVFISDQAGWHDTPVYDGASLTHGHELEGPLLIEEQTTTVFAGAGDRVIVDAAGNFMVELASGGASHGA
jgi:N-methylhydantoinase A